MWMSSPPGANVKLPRTNVKPPYWRLSGDGSVKRLICVEFTMITTFMRQFSKSCNRWLEVPILWQTRIAYSSTWKRFQNRCEWSACFHGEFSLWCRNRTPFCKRPFALQRQQLENNKQNVDVVPLEKFLQTPVATSTLSASFHVWANQAKPTMCEIENWSKRIQTTQPFLIIYFLLRNCLRWNQSIHCSIHLHCLFLILECSL